jgi:hypothetical protein
VAFPLSIKQECHGELPQFTAKEAKKGSRRVSTCSYVEDGHEVTEIFDSDEDGPAQGITWGKSGDIPTFQHGDDTSSNTLFNGAFSLKNHYFY